VPLRQSDRLSLHPACDLVVPFGEAGS
jgi:hypothetical protein